MPSDIEIEIDSEIDREITIRIEHVRELLESILKLLKKRKKRAVRLAIYNAENPHTEVIGMDVALSNTDTRRLIIVPLDDKAKREKIQAGTMKATSADESVATVALDPADEMQAIVTPVDDAQSPEAKFSFSADADLGEGVVEVTGEYSCPIVDQMATMLQVTSAGDTPKDAPAPAPTRRKP